MIKPAIVSEVMNLVKNGVDRFYVGAEGIFDHYVKNTLALAKVLYPHIEYSIVLSRLPEKDKLSHWVDPDCTIVPEGIEKTHPKYAIDKRNRWMLDRADYVVVYVTHSFGGAAKFMREAERKGKIVINLADKK